jgi:hypothetical protein
MMALDARVGPSIPRAPIIIRLSAGLSVELLAHYRLESANSRRARAASGWVCQMMAYSLVA